MLHTHAACRVGMMGVNHQASSSFSLASSSCVYFSSSSRSFLSSCL